MYIIKSVCSVRRLRSTLCPEFSKYRLSGNKSLSLRIQQEADRLSTASSKLSSCGRTQIYIKTRSKKLPHKSLFLHCWVRNKQRWELRVCFRSCFGKKEYFHREGFEWCSEYSWRREFSLYLWEHNTTWEQKMQICFQRSPWLGVESLKILQVCSLF